MTRYGYFLSSEEYDPASLIRQAKMAEQAGFEALWISDHFHPWLDEQGNSSFVWSVIGAISQVTSLPITTAVTCPTTRIHPAIIAQAAATAGLLTDGKFTLGVGTGEALNEHVTGEPWPAAEVRRDMLEEAVGIIAELFAGGQVTHHGPHYTVETARLYSRPDRPPPIYVSGFGEQSAELAARIADGYICIGPEADLVKRFRDQGGGAKPVQGGLKGCWAPDAGKARSTLRQLWPSDFIPGESAQLLPTPRHFGQLAPLVTDELVTAPAGPDPKPYLEALSSFEQAGFDEVYLQQVGGNLEGAFEFFATQVLPRARGN
ncbi:MAG TPA: TIGR03557 family F420-dependent LLM class oxidoreductase [Trebonia sp.]|jgi:G6PDH family F420-dependent oxidoreductase|nr:TIGR03557 family F420-dependent LLM class oxidoreductase [Trebonia sp.]